MFKKKKFTRFVFREIEPIDNFSLNEPKKTDGFVFIAEIELPENYDAEAKGYNREIGYTCFNKGLLTMDIFDTAIFSKYYKIKIPVEQAKADFLNCLKIRKKYYEQIS